MLWAAEVAGGLYLSFLWTTCCVLPRPPLAPQPDPEHWLGRSPRTRILLNAGLNSQAIFTWELPIRLPRLSQGCIAVWGPPSLLFLTKPSPFPLSFPGVTPTLQSTGPAWLYSPHPSHFLFLKISPFPYCTSKSMLASASWRLQTDSVGKRKAKQGQRERKWLKYIQSS